MSLIYNKIMSQCAKYGCSFVHTVGTNCKIVSKCGHETIVSPNQFNKHKIGVYCVECLDNILQSENANCINCEQQFIPTETKFLFCSSSCASSISMTESRKKSLRENMLKKISAYLNDDGSLKSDEEIAEIKKSKKRKISTIDIVVGDNVYTIQKKGKFVDFSKIKSDYEEKGCKLLTTEEEYLLMKQTKPLKAMIFDIVSLCGHNEKSLYYSFTESNTCLYCKRCTLIRARETLIGQAKTDEGFGTSLMTQKLAIDIIKQKCELDFEAIKTRDGCNSDLLVRPREFQDIDCWLKLKIKSTVYGENEISFRINKLHQAVYMFVSIATQEIWLFDPENISVRTYYVTHQRELYKDNAITGTDDLVQKLRARYLERKHVGTFEKLNEPISPAMKLEYKYVLLREKTISFLNFIRNNITGAVYNFKVGNLKFQESVVSKQHKKNSCYINMCKNSRQKTKKPYDVGDNDFYWFNINDETETFYVVPENALIESGHIQTESQPGEMYLSIGTTEWLFRYMFNYKTISDTNEKDRLVSLLGLVSV